jgi:NADPH-dependent 7-cyano-7-deazaguanine reductase QueF-like protein
MSGSSRDALSGDIVKFVINSNKNTSTKAFLQDKISDIYYYESVLNETVRAQVMYIDSGASVNNKSVIEGLPLVGEEKVEIKIKDANDVELDLTLYVNSVKPLTQDVQKSVISVDLVSKEDILNHQKRVNVRFDGKISDHVTRILTDQNFLNCQKTLDIEQTENNYNFIGNNRKPFYLLTWLSKYGIPSVPNARGKTAGFFFYETSQGYKFKSIDKLLEQTPVRKILFNDMQDAGGERIPPGYDTKALELTTDSTINVQSKRESGAYSTRLILFDPFNCVYEIIKPRSEENVSGMKLAGSELPTFNREFNQGASDNFTRTTYMLVDKGTLPTGNTQQQIEEKAKEINFDPKNVLNQSTMRYNQLFTITKTVLIAGDFSLHAGDTVELHEPEVASEKDTKDTSREFGGIYMIADLCHYMTRTSTYTKLNLVRDSYGSRSQTNYRAL